MTVVQNILKILSGGYKPEYRQKVLYALFEPTNVFIGHSINHLETAVNLPYDEIKKCLKILKLETEIIEDKGEIGQIGDLEFPVTVYRLKKDLSEEFKSQLKEGLEKLIH